MNKDMIKPPVVLTLICLIVCAALVLTYQFTLPMIEASKAAAADASRREVLAEASEFVELPLEEAITAGIGQVTAISEGKANGQTVGWVFTSNAKGYGGAVVVMCGIDTEGMLTKVKVTEHSETPGLGSKVADPSYTDQFSAADRDGAAQIDAISGVTYTSTAVKASIEAAYAAYEKMAKEEI
ncbi:MAG: FMN-binding protein [Bacillota bacterium]|nr:FMN-binding protein [Bacillota bacterium]